MTYLNRRVLRLVAVPVALASVLAGLGPVSAASASTCVSVTGTQPATATFDLQVFGVAMESACDAWMVGDTLPTTTLATLIEHWNGSSWTAVPSVSPGNFESVLNAVAASSPTNAWAVGHWTNDGGPDGSPDFPDQPLIEHWNGTSWSQSAVSVPVGDDNRLFGVSVVSATSAFAVGVAGSTSTGTVSSPLIEQWNGSNWSQLTVPNPDPAADVRNVLQSVTTTSATDGWAVGSSILLGQPSVPFIEHWNGSAWSLVPAPSLGGASAELTGVSATSATDAWAVGQIGDPDTASPLIEHWDGTSWSVVPAPDPSSSGKQADFFGVAATSSTDAWATGTFVTDNITESPFLEHWDGTSWSLVPMPAPVNSEGLAVAAAPNHTGWVVGDLDAAGTRDDIDPLALHLQCC